MRIFFWLFGEYPKKNPVIYIVFFGIKNKINSHFITKDILELSEK